MKQITDNIKEVDGDLIYEALEGSFDVIIHGCNCFCTQGAGIAKTMSEVFRTNDPSLFPLEGKEHIGDYGKLGNIQSRLFSSTGDGRAHPADIHTDLIDQIQVVNCYTQYNYGRNSPGCSSPVDAGALLLCLKKVNYMFKGKHIGLPKIGSGLGGLDWPHVELMIKTVMTDVDVTIINFVKK